MPNMIRPRTRPAISNRLYALMIHVPWFSIEGTCRLAAECKVAHSTISRLARNQLNPSYFLARSVTDALSRRMGIPLDMREIFSTDGTYPTSCVCDLTPDCHGCYPPEAYDAEENLKPDYHDLRPGDWCRFPPSSISQPGTSAISLTSTDEPIRF